MEPVIDFVASNATEDDEEKSQKSPTKDSPVLALSSSSSSLSEATVNLSAEMGPTGLPDLEFDLTTRPFLTAVLEAMDSNENDYAALFALCLLHSLVQNSGSYIKSNAYFSQILVPRT